MADKKPNPDGANDATRLLKAAAAGDAGAVEALFNLVYGQLHIAAQRQMALERRDHTLGPTALVHEAYLNLFVSAPISWQDRNHFFSVAARAMRRILIDHARERNAKKRGGGGAPIPLDESLVSPPTGEAPISFEDFLALDEVLQRFEKQDPRAAQVFQFRYFTGMEHEQIARALDVSPRTVKSDWKIANAWIMRELKRSTGAGPEQPRE
jgi:RNA polymerase sigma factor (TIGR02999 family)